MANACLLGYFRQFAAVSGF